jgi:two-component system KDP operon response regulator KdpE
MKNQRKFVADDASFLTVRELEESLGLEDQSDAPVLILANRDAERRTRIVRAANVDSNKGKASKADKPSDRVVEYVRRPFFVPKFVSDDLEIDFQRRSVIAQGRAVRLTPNEFDLLRYLVAEQGHPLEHGYLLKRVWGRAHPREIESLRVLINQLRKKIEPDPAHPKYIHTESRIGYRFEPARFGPKHRKSRASPD